MMAFKHNRNGRLNASVALAMAAVAACLLVTACSGNEGGEAIRALIADGAALAEAHDVAGLLDLATEDVRAMPMNLDRRGIKGVLWRTFSYYGPLTILYPRPAVEIGADRRSGSVRVPFLIVKTAQRFPDLDRLRDDPKAWVTAVGETADLYRLHLAVTNRGGTWRVSRATLERFTGTGFD